ncbi:hypothetical protein [Granulicella aggregans]|uniref:hypothetical protein n=1 Tax=Granulicella aggregans TaxID=474949 RepID=UPI0021DF51E9|nr:hypothetical protein [Granulicella aggregans]
MAKAAALDIDLAAPTHQPPAATSPRTMKEKGREAEPSKNDTPVNFRWPAAEVKALKRAALEADMTQQDYLLSCFHAFLQAKS